MTKPQSRAALLRQFTGTDSKVRATIANARTAEDWPEMCTNFRKSYGIYPQASIGVNAANDQITAHVGGRTAYLNKPKLNRVRVGKMTATATRYAFEWNGKESHGAIADLAVTGEGLALTMFNGGLITYTLES